MDNHLRSEFLSAFTDQALGEDQRALIQSHIRHCADCRHALRSLENVQWMVQRLPKKKLPANFALNMRAMAAGRLAQRAWSRLELWIPTMGVMGLLAFALWMQWRVRGLESLPPKEMRHSYEGTLE